MEKVEALEALGFIGQAQLGMFTTAQAVRSGVSRLCDGVYATWRFITKTRNLAVDAECVIVSGQTAAVLHDFGDIETTKRRLYGWGASG